MNYQVSLPCREPQGRVDIRWKHGQAAARTRTHGVASPNLSCQCSVSRSSTRRSTRKPSSYCANTPTCRLRTRKGKPNAKRAATRAFSPHSLMVTANLHPKPDADGPSAASSCPVIIFWETENRTTRTTQSFPTEAITCGSSTRIRKTTSKSASISGMCSPSWRSTLFRARVRTHSGTTMTSNAPPSLLPVPEYIFSENVGILGHLSARKEQTFDALSALRTNGFSERTT